MEVLGSSYSYIFSINSEVLGNRPILVLGQNYFYYSSSLSSFMFLGIINPFLEIHIFKNVHFFIVFPTLLVCFLLLFYLAFWHFFQLAYRLPERRGSASSLWYLPQCPSLEKAFDETVLNGFNFKTDHRLPQNHFLKRDLHLTSDKYSCMM